MKNLILEIRNRLNASQEDLARMIGISYATVNRWENGHSQPNKAAQLRLYDICKVAPKKCYCIMVPNLASKVPLLR